MEKLKKCPFCGNEKIEFVGFLVPFINCDKCGAVVSFRGKEKPEQTVQEWNKRDIKPKYWDKILKNEAKNGDLRGFWDETFKMWDKIGGKQTC